MTKCLSKNILHMSVAGGHAISLNLNKCFKQSKEQHGGNSKAYTITLVYFFRFWDDLRPGIAKNFQFCHVGL